MMFIHKRAALAFAASFGLLLGISAQAQVNVTTWHNDPARTGANTHEQVLTTANVNVDQFGRLFQITLDGQVYAQPLVLAGVQIAGGTHNVVYVATEHDSVYAIDGDNGTIYRQVSLIPAGGPTINASSDLVQQCLDINPEIGITGTPVIDPASQTLYVVTKAKVAGRLVQHLHALDIATLAEKFGGPTEIQATSPGTAPDGDRALVSFNPSAELQRPGLALDNGHVLISWASHCDHDAYHGWLISYDAQTLVQDGVWNVTPNGAPVGTSSKVASGCRERLPRWTPTAISTLPQAMVIKTARQISATASSSSDCRPMGIFRSATISRPSMRAGAARWVIPTWDPAECCCCQRPRTALNASPRPARRRPSTCWI